MMPYNDPNRLLTSQSRHMHKPVKVKLEPEIDWTKVWAFLGVFMFVFLFWFTLIAGVLYALGDL
jgi:hypothetical protein